jgi:hypothetical protein
MADKSARAVVAWRGLLLAGLAIAAWSVTRVVRLLTGDDSVVADDDVHGYAAIFSLVLIPVLAVAVVSIVTAFRRRGRIAPGVTLALSAPLAGPLAIAALAIGAALVATALLTVRGAFPRGGPAT